MPPKRKAPLATADINTPRAPTTKRTTRGKKAVGAPPAAAAKKLYKYSDPSTIANQRPVDVIFFAWPGSKNDEDEEDEDDEEEDDPELGLLQAILNQLENDKTRAVDDAVNARMNNNIVSSSEIVSIRDATSKPFVEKADKAREEFVKAGTMTAEDARAVVGVDDWTKKEKRRVTKRVQEKLNGIERKRHKAVQEALNSDKKRLTIGERRARIAKAEKPFWEEMKKTREAAENYTQLTAEEVQAIMPNIELDDEGNEIPKESGKKDKDAEKKPFVPPRVVTEEGFPVSKAGMEKFIEINQEVDKRDQDTHGIYIYNDFSGYGVTEVMENVLAEFNKLIFKKEVSPIEKWAVVEGLTLYLAMGDLMVWMMNDDSEGMEEVFGMMGVMFITALEMLHESTLIGSTSPLPDNIGVMTLHFLDFMVHTCSDYDLEWVHEVVRAADKYGAVLTPVKQIEGIDQDILDELREEWEERKKVKDLAWKTEYPKFKRNHPGGHKYEIARMSKAEKAQYEFGHTGEDSDLDLDSG